MGTYKMQILQLLCENLKDNVAYTIWKAYFMNSIASVSGWNK